MKSTFNTYTTTVLAALTFAIAIPVQAVDAGFVEKLFVPAGTGAVPRTFNDKGRDTVSVRDFGAKCDGVTNDTPAFQLAANSAAVVIVPYCASAYLLNTHVAATGNHFILHGQLSGAGRLSGAAITQFDKANFKIGYKGMFGYTDNAVAQIYRDLAAPVGIQQSLRSIVQSKGDNATFIGGVAGYFESRDRSDVTALNKGVLYGLSLSVVPSIARNNVPYDDVDGLTISNSTGKVGAKATDAIYISTNAFAFGNKLTGTSEWYSIFTADNNADVGIALNGRLANYAIDLKRANIVSGSAIRLPNNTAIVGRDAGDASDRTLIKISSSNVVEVGAGASRVDLKAPAIATAGMQVTGYVKVNSGYFATNAPQVKSASAYTVVDTDNFLIFTNASTNTLILPAAGSYTGRVLTVKTTQNNALISASSNVVPLVDGSAGTAILAAIAGKWATLVSDGAVWQIMAGN